MLFLIICCFLATVISPTIGLLTLVYVKGVVPIENFLKGWSVWYIGDVLGVLVFAPLLIEFEDCLKKNNLSSNLKTPNLLFFAAVILFSFLVFGFNRGATFSSFPFLYLIYPVLVWGAVRFQALTLLVGVLILTTISIICTWANIGPFAKTSQSYYNLLALQLFLGVSTCLTYLLHSTINEWLEKLDQMRIRQGLATKFANIGQIASSVAHEVNNPLNILLFNNEKLEDFEVSKKIEPEYRRILEAQEKTIKRISDIVKGLQFFAKEKNDALEATDLAAISNSFLILIRGTLKGQQVEIETDFEKQEIFALANAGKVEQIFLNLIQNSKDARISEKPLVIKIKISKSGEKISLEFSDNGKGMDQTTLDNVFTPYFSTKDMNRESGMGLGLSIIKNLVYEMQGQVIVDSTQGVGTSFKFLFDSAPTPPPVLKEEEPVIDKSSDQLPLRVLVVDDEAMLRDLVCERIRSRGHSVYSANDGEEAFKLCKRQKYDAIITDHQMPKMNGITLAQKLRDAENGDELYIILLSGLSGYSNSLERKTKENLFNKIFSKPCRLKDLFSALEEAKEKRTRLPV
ncbi:MAG: response regulator [Halobacteriovoraceae bacterium]|nr:response regulator [Halobacteriovoraceae bacterium]